MRVVVDISLYPLRDAYLEAIRGFIERLNGYPELEVSTNALSTHVSGDYDRVFEILRDEMKRVHASGQAVFVTRVLSADARP
jgi:uncharacterized protein YqgV (UPF0045/DUF77 family)